MWRVDCIINQGNDADIRADEELGEEEIVRVGGYYLPPDVDQLDVADSISSDAINAISAIIDCRSKHNEKHLKTTIKNTMLDIPMKDSTDYNFLVVDKFAVYSDEALTHFLNLYEAICTGIPNGSYDLLSLVYVNRKDVQQFQMHGWNIIDGLSTEYVLACRVQDMWGRL